MKPPGDGSPPGDERVDDSGGAEERVDADDDVDAEERVDADDDVDADEDVGSDESVGSDRGVDTDEAGTDDPVSDGAGVDDEAATADGGEAAAAGDDTAASDGEAGAVPTDDGPPAKRAGGGDADGPEVLTPTEFARRLWTTDHGGIAAVREMLSTAAIVLLVGALLFGVSGVWPPMVAIESGSMTPHMQVGDLVFVMDEERLKPAAAEGDTGVVTYQAGEAAGYRTFQSYGDVVVYRPDGSVRQTPIIHRARFWVEEGENWYQTKANPEYVNPNYRNCEQLPACPAPHAGFVTKGDANSYYDQAIGMSSPVKPEWVTGTSEFRIPWLGCIRLGFPPGCLSPPRTIPGSWVVLGVLAVLALAASSIERG